MSAVGAKGLRIGLGVPHRGFAGGIERHAYDLARALRQRGHRLSLLYAREQGRDPGTYAAPFERVLPARESGSLHSELDVVYTHRANDVSELRAFGRLPVVVASHDHELTCVRTYRYLPWNLAPCHRAPGTACVLNGCVLVKDKRDDALLPLTLANPFGLRARVRRLAERAPLVANSEYVANNLRKAGVPTGRIRVIYPVPPEGPAPPSAQPREPVLAVIGNLLRGKGVDLAIAALARLRRQVRLLVVGDGPLRAALEAQARDIAPGRVDFVGHVAADRMHEFYDRARLVLVPARWPEPFGMTGIEAMRRARPVVAAGHGGIPEWLPPEAGGRLFVPGDQASLAAAAKSVLEDDLAGERARRFACERFSHAQMVDQVESLLCSEVAQVPSAAPRHTCSRRSAV